VEKELDITALRETLTTNWAQWGVLTKAEKEVFKAEGLKNCLWLDTLNDVWAHSAPGADFDDPFIYRIKAITTKPKTLDAPQTAREFIQEEIYKVKDAMKGYKAAGNWHALPKSMYVLQGLEEALDVCNSDVVQ